jgi:hypothetical protein
VVVRLGSVFGSSVAYTPYIHTPSRSTYVGTWLWDAWKCRERERDYNYLKAYKHAENWVWIVI